MTRTAVGLAETPRPALVVRDMRKRFGPVVALDGLAFTANRGEILTMLGPNGAGKTTALRCVAGVLLADDGQATVGGARARSRAAQQAVSYLPETPDLYPALTVAEHLRFIALAYRVDGWRDRAEALLSGFALDEHRDKIPAGMSQGMRRKTALAMALLQGAEVLLLDEPFNGLDPLAAAELRATVGDLARQGAAVVVSTHDLAVAQSLANRIVVMDRGRDLAVGTMTDLRTAAGVGDDADLEEVFLTLTHARLADGGRSAE